MLRWTPCKRSDFIRRLQRLGFEGPYSGARHQFFVKGNHRLTVPTNFEYSVPQLRLLLRETAAITRQNISLEDWEPLA